MGHLKRSATTEFCLILPCRKWSNVVVSFDFSSGAGNQNVCMGACVCLCTDMYMLGEKGE